MRCAVVLLVGAQLVSAKVVRHEVNPGGKLQITNPATLSKIDKRLPLYLSLEPQGPRFRVLEVHEPVADLYASFYSDGAVRLASDFWSKNGLKELKHCLSKLTAASNVLLGKEKGDKNQAWDEYVACLASLDKEVSLAFARNDFLGKKLQAPAMQFLFSVRSVVQGQARAAKLPWQRKTNYGKRDTFSPYHYTNIRSRCDGGAAIVRSSRDRSEVFASGVLIGLNLVLTCAHDVEDVPLEQLAVRFDYQVKEPGKEPGGQEFRVRKVVSGRPFDFTILELGLLKGRSPGHTRPIQPLDERPVGLGDPLYVVGHPGGRPREVADNAFVLFPHVASLRQIGAMSAAVRKELALYRDAWIQERLSRIPNELRGVEKIAAKVKEEVRKECDELFSDFRSSYVENPKKPGVYVHRSKRWGGRLSIGADSDTNLGNSGSPVYSKRGHRIVGILLEGAPDNVRPLVPGWVFHERILPIEVVIRKLRAVYPNMTDRGVIIVGPKAKRE